MNSYSFTGTLTDIGLGALTEQFPVMTVRPEVSAFGPDGLVSDVRVPVGLVGDAFSMDLVASAELTPVSGGRSGVLYVIEVGRFDLADDLTKVWHGTEQWRFTAVLGGGNVGQMPNVRPEWNVPWGFGPPPATVTTGLYYDASVGMMYGESGGN